ncbi:hypothetical protein [Paludisphaera rhizosphaerae]|uniref:hypothetical protein n=1 Tax=Paludisphaera rhizosphaerae TaxID=2711216 RepID=UPI001F0DADD5|nr:hypothetical protein [Paludisphaera rhizosphaerae]
MGRDVLDRVVCPRCGVKIRVRRSGNGAVTGEGDGLIRFHCPCGRRLKVRAQDRPEAGRCPDCGTVVPVPKPVLASVSTLSSPRTPSVGVRNGAFAGPEDARTEELDADDIARIQRWAARYGVYPEDEGKTSQVPPPRSPSESGYTPPPALKVEAGLRICPKCGRPLHMSAVSCRACGAATPKA